MGKHDGTGTGLAGVVLIAGLIGAGAALLLTPKSGKETRADLRWKMDEAKRNARRKREEYAERIHDVADDVSDIAHDKIERVRSRANDKADEAKEAVKEARERVEDATKRSEDIARSSRR